MSFIRIWTHCVWSTKNRIPFLTERIKQPLVDHIIKNAIEKGIYIDCINGHLDHIHALVSLGSRQNISDIMQLIKGESSFWINKEKMTRIRFSWQDDFYAVSVSHSAINKVRSYIKGQVDHHKKISLQEELKTFNEKFDFMSLKG